MQQVHAADLHVVRARVVLLLQRLQSCLADVRVQLGVEEEVHRVRTLAALDPADKIGHPLAGVADVGRVRSCQHEPALIDDARRERVVALRRHGLPLVDHREVAAALLHASRRVTRAQRDGRAVRQEVGPVRPPERREPLGGHDALQVFERLTEEGVARRDDPDDRTGARERVRDCEREGERALTAATAARERCIEDLLARRHAAIEVPAQPIVEPLGRAELAGVQANDSRARRVADVVLDVPIPSPAEARDQLARLLVDEVELQINRGRACAGGLVEPLVGQAFDRL